MTRESDVHSSTAPARLRAALGGSELVRAVGAHDALGARLAERAGFDCVWSSGLEISASHGVPDADLLTMSEMLDAASWMAGAVPIPVIADCDAGYGNATNVAHMVRRFEACGVAGICIEDKTIPKRNSFLPGLQTLVSVGEFVGKLTAAIDARRDPDFVVIGRVEALVAGLDVDDALVRGRAYADAGADVVLVHAKSRSPQPILEFLTAWDRSVPVAVVPTTYWNITGRELHEAGARLVIYANHGLRAAVQAVVEAFSAIREADGTATVEERIAPLDMIFELQNVPQMLADEQRLAECAGAVWATEAKPGP